MCIVFAMDLHSLIRTGRALHNLRIMVLGLPGGGVQTLMILATWKVAGKSTLKITVGTISRALTLDRPLRTQTGSASVLCAVSRNPFNLLINIITLSLYERCTCLFTHIFFKFKVVLQFLVVLVKNN